MSFSLKSAGLVTAGGSGTGCSPGACVGFLLHCTGAPKEAQGVYSQVPVA